MNSITRMLAVTLLISSAALAQPNPLGWLTGKTGTTQPPAQACPTGCQPISSCKYKTGATLPADPKCPDACIASSVCEES